MEKEPKGDLEDILLTIADNEYKGVIYVDAGGTVRFISQGYADFLNINREAIIGRYVNDVILDCGGQPQTALGSGRQPGVHPHFRGRLYCGGMLGSYPDTGNTHQVRGSKESQPDNE